MASLDDFTLGEIDMIENITGASIGSIAGEDKPQARFLMAMATVLRKREDPEFTLEDASKLRMSELQDIIGSDDEDAPGEA